MRHFDLNAKKVGGLSGLTSFFLMEMTLDWQCNAPGIVSGLGTNDGIFECWKQ